MTICIGMRAEDGIVIAADAEESDHYYKRAQQKIFPFQQMHVGANPQAPTFAYAFTGAGNSGYLDAFFHYAMSRLPKQTQTIADVERSLGEEILKFHCDHLFPLAHANDPPQIEVLIGAYVNFQTAMFVSHGSTVRTGGFNMAVGAGSHFALGLMGNLNRGQDLACMELIAAYVVALTKESIEGCGKYTEIVSIHSPKIEGQQPSRLVPPDSPLTFVPSSKIRKWEESFALRWAGRQQQTILSLVDEELGDDARRLAPQTSEGQQ
jgi:20S proteasome alpha/beta subunit